MNGIDDAAGETASCRRRFLAGAVIGAGAVLTGCSGSSGGGSAQPAAGVTVTVDLDPAVKEKIIAAIANRDSSGNSLWATPAAHENWLKLLFSDVASDVDSAFGDAMVNIPSSPPDERNKIRAILNSMQLGANALGLAAYKRVQAQTVCPPCEGGDDPPPPPETY